MPEASSMGGIKRPGFQPNESPLVSKGEIPSPECAAPLKGGETDELELSLALHRRSIGSADLERFEGYIAEIFAALGLNLDTPATRSTPRRFLRALIDSTEGYEGDPKLVTVFETECQGGSDCQLAQVVEAPIPFYGMCEHHALPIVGEAAVAYIAHEHIIGLSKLVRLVRLFAKRFTVQERLGRQIADTLMALLQPHGVAVYLQAHHLCMEMRGVRGPMTETRTTVWRGEYERNPALRSEFFVACGAGHQGRGWL